MQKAKEREGSSLKWIKRSLKLENKKSDKPVFLIEPLVILGDLDKDIEGRIRFSSQSYDKNFLEEYSKLKIMDLSEVHAGGAGNAPILGNISPKSSLTKKPNTSVIAIGNLSIPISLIPVASKRTNHDYTFIYSVLAVVLAQVWLQNLV